MYPIDTPGIILRTAISMFDILRQYKKLKGSYLVLLVSYFIPSLSINTIKQKVFWQSFFSVGIVALGFGIKSKAANI
jgi:hypothetical protein